MTPVQRRQVWTIAGGCPEGNDPTPTGDPIALRNCRGRGCSARFFRRPFRRRNDWVIPAAVVSQG